MAIEKAVTIKAADGVTEGYVYYPSENGSWPAVIHWQHLGGIGDVNRQMCKDLADGGFVVLLPNQFYRTKKTPIFDEFPFTLTDPRALKLWEDLRTPLNFNNVSRDTRAYADFLFTLPQVKKGKIGTVGYCMGGGLSLFSAAGNPDLVGAMVSLHGGGLFTGEETSPHLLLNKIKGKQYYGHGKDDQFMTAQNIKDFEAELKKHGADAISETYDAHHGWTHVGSRVYNEAAARKSEKATLDTFKAAL